MDKNTSQKPSALVIGLSLIIGECVIGVNGPFLFSRIGMNVPESVATGVLVGATIGFGLAEAGLRSLGRLAVLRNALHSEARGKRGRVPMLLRGIRG